MENMPSARLNLYSSVDWSIQQNGFDGGPGSWQAIEPLATPPCEGMIRQGANQSRQVRDDLACRDAPCVHRSDGVAMRVRREGSCRMSRRSGILPASTVS